MLVSAGGGLPRNQVGGGLRLGELGRVRVGARSGLGWVARHDGVRSVPRYCALPQHVSPKTRVPVVTGPSTCCRWRVCLAGEILWLGGGPEGVWCALRVPLCGASSGVLWACPASWGASASWLAGLGGGAGGHRGGGR